MQPFEHLMVLFSIIIGLGLTSILVGVSKLLRARPPARGYWVHTIWVCLAFVIQVGLWWQRFAQRDVADWNFLTMLLLLVSPVLLFLVADMALPDDVAGVDLRACYYECRRAFFLFFTATLASYTLVDVLIKGESIAGVKQVSRTIGIGVVPTLPFSDDPRFHAAGTVFSAFAISVVYARFFFELG